LYIKQVLRKLTRYLILTIFLVVSRHLRFDCHFVGTHCTNENHTDD